MAIINQVVSGADGHYINLEPDSNGKLIMGNGPVNLAGIKDLSADILKYCRRGSNYTGEFFTNAEELTQITGAQALVGCGLNSRISSFSLPNLETISGSNVFTYNGDAAFANSNNTNNYLTSVSLPKLTTVSGSYSAESAFYNCKALTTVDLSSLTTIDNNGCRYMFSDCKALTTVDLSSLTTVTNSGALEMFYNCTALTTVDVSSLTTATDSGARGMFYNCTALTTVDVSSLTTVTNGGANSMFYNCTALTSIYLPKITSPSYASRPTVRDFYAFDGSGLQIFDARNIQSCGDYGLFDNMLSGTLYLTTVNLNSLEHIGTEGARAMVWIGSGSSNTLTDLYFPMLTTFGTNPFYTNAFTGRNGLTIHFRKDAQATVEALPNYATLWGAGTGSSVVFDLAGTLTGADSNSYTRSEINSVYASETAGAAKTATGWKYNDTVYYTSGGTEPAVGDTIYSDAACTTAVTTISAIA